MDFVWAFASFAKSPHTLKFGIRRFEKYQHNDKWLFLYKKKTQAPELLYNISNINLLLLVTHNLLCHIADDYSLSPKMSTFGLKL